MLEKQMTFHHSVTENGNLQVRQVEEYTKDGEVISQKYGDPYTPEDVLKMDGFDDRSKEIVAAIIAPDVLVAFVGQSLDALKKAVEDIKAGGDYFLQEVVTYDRAIEADGKIAVRQITRIFDHGIEVSKKYHRSWIMPGDDPTGNDVMSKAIALKLHTSECIKAYKDKIAKATMEI